MDEQAAQSQPDEQYVYLLCNLTSICYRLLSESAPFCQPQQFALAVKAEAEKRAFQFCLHHPDNAADSAEMQPLSLLLHAACFSGMLLLLINLK